MRKICILMLALLCAIPAFSAESAQQVIARCARKVSTAPSVTFNFALNYGDKATPCQLVVAKEKYHLTSPQMKVWYDGTTQWTYADENRELSITEPTTDELLEANPFAILNHYDKVFTARKLAGGDKGTYIVELTAKSKANNIRRAVVTINTATSMPAKMVVTLANGRTFTVEVTSATVGTKAAAASTFIYDKKKFPASEIIDLR